MRLPMVGESSRLATRLCPWLRISLGRGAFLGLLVFSATPVFAAADDPRLADIAKQCVADQERFWKRLSSEGPWPTLGSRSLVSYALALCESRQHPDRLQKLFELTAQMQDRDPKSPHYGNLKWSWRDPGVTDANAVEFCGHDAILIWKKHRDWLPAPARAVFEQWLTLAVDGCMRHRVPTFYSNIAYLNAGNLVVLGESFDRPEAAAEGYRRLDEVCRWTYYFGTREYCSPTYYAVNFEGAALLARYAQQERGRLQAAALQTLLWTDVALNWFPPAQRLAGAHSRSYDYLRGRGHLEEQLALAGWLQSGGKPDSNAFHAALCPSSPQPGLLETNRQAFPRLVRQRWGMQRTDSRTHMMYRDITLSTAAAGYGALQDATLTVDLPGEGNSPRCYFIPDGRRDPYGKNRYDTGSAGHMKALHLEPFWTAAQRSQDALGLVIYRPDDLKAPVTIDCQSHFVFRRSQQMWLRGQPVPTLAAKKDKPAVVPVGIGDPLVVKYGSAAVGIRWIWARAQDGRPASVALIDDANPHGVLRLTVEHHRDAATELAGAALWVRAGSGLDNQVAFDAWRTRFEKAQPTRLEVDAKGVALAIPGEEGVVAVRAASPFLNSPVDLEPEPTRGILELDGQEIGRAILAAVEPIRSAKAKIDLLSPLQFSGEQQVRWEAEDGMIFGNMRSAKNAEAGGGKCVLEPAPPAAPKQLKSGGTKAESEPSPLVLSLGFDPRANKLPKSARPSGLVQWHIQVAQPGRYWLWARVMASNPETDSFYVGAKSETAELMPRGAWHLRVTPKWQWQPLILERATGPTPLDLPAGLCVLEMATREKGAQVDQLMLTPRENDRPKD